MKTREKGESVNARSYRNVPVLLLGMALSLTGCAEDIDASELSALMFDDDGVVAGIEFGESWDAIKSSHADGWEVREDTGGQFAIRQLRREYSGSPFSGEQNMAYVGVDLDDSGNVRAIDLNVTGYGDSMVVARRFLDQLREHVGGMSGVEFVSEGNYWQYQSEAAGTHKVFITHTDGGGSFSVSMRTEARR